LSISRKLPRLTDADVAKIYAAPDPESVEESEEHAASREEQDRFERLLVAHDIDRVLLVVLAFALKNMGVDLTRAKELQRRAYTKLWERRDSWDPAKVSLTAYMCGLVRSENSHDAEKAETRLEHEDAAATEAAALGRAHAPSPEDMALDLERADEDRRKALGKLEPLRLAFVQAKDKVNLVWLKMSLEGLDTPAEMAERTGIPVREFYLAADRRKRHVERLLAGMRTKEEERA
jgi:hypothetical protein